MPGISQRRFHSTIRGPSADALDILAKDQQDILREWRHELEAMNIRTDLVAGVPSDFSTLGECVRRSVYPEFRMRLQAFGGKLARRGVRLDHSVMAIHRLFEIAIPYLAQSEARQAKPVLALARLHALVVLLIVYGYTNERSSGKKQARLPRIEGQRQRASAYVTRIYEEERQRLSRDLHDEVGNNLIVLKMYLELIAADSSGVRSGKQSGPRVLPRLTEAIGLVSHAIDSVRRLVLDIGPAIFDELTFLPAVRTYISQFSSRTKIPVILTEGCLPDDIPKSHQVALYRLLQGALSNVLEHASAKNVAVSLECVRDSAVALVIKDDGVGFDMATMPERRSFGLTAMRERVEVLGGRIDIQSKLVRGIRRSHGTRIEVELPLPGKAA